MVTAVLIKLLTEHSSQSDVSVSTTNAPPAGTTNLLDRRSPLQLAQNIHSLCCLKRHAVCLKIQTCPCGRATVYFRTLLKIFDRQFEAKGFNSNCCTPSGVKNSHQHTVTLPVAATLIPLFVLYAALWIYTSCAAGLSWT